MPSGSVKLIPGVNTQKSPALNEAGISASDMIRFRAGLVEKRGGWNRYYPFPYSAIPRAVLPFEDLNATVHVAVGTATQLSVITNGVSQDITPQNFTTNPALNFSTVINTNVVTIVDVANNSTIFDVVQIQTPITVGGVVLLGLYAINSIISGDSYTILAATNATATINNAGAVPSFTTTSGQFAVAVTFAAHGLSVGSTAIYPVATSVGGLTLQGFYTVQSVASSSAYTIDAPMLASSNATVSMNGGNSQIIYWVSVVPLAAALGYGQGGYGTGGYGTGASGAPRTATPITTDDWSLDNFGGTLVACPHNGPIFQWNPNSGFMTATIIATAPSVNTGIFVSTGQQMIVAYGSSFNGQQDPNLMRWTDAGRLNVWAPTVINQAGSYRIPTGSGVVGATTTAQEDLIWTDVDLWSMQYVGPPPAVVWGFNKLGNGCGLIGRSAYAKLGPAVYWMSQRQFWVFNGTPTVQACTVWDNVFNNLASSSNFWKIRGASNSQFGEAVWFFPSATGTGENNGYVSFNALENAWDVGSMARTAWADQSVIGAPIGAGLNGLIYQHETSPDGDGAPIAASFTTGYFMISNGEDFNFIDWMRPDFKYQSASATITVYVLVSYYAPDAPVSFGPFTISEATEFINLRCRGRMAAFKAGSSDLGSVWRIGNVQFRYAPDGRR